MEARCSTICTGKVLAAHRCAKQVVKIKAEKGSSFE
jgi:hypothetical protein